MNKKSKDENPLRKGLLKKEKKAQYPDPKVIPVSDEIYKTIVENTDILISVTNFGINPSYIYVNPAHFQIMGYKQEDLIGVNGFDLIHPADRLKLLPVLKKYLSKKIDEIFKITRDEFSEILEFRAKDKHNKWRNFECFAKLIPGSRILFISRDITEKKRVEKELSRIKTDWRSIFNALKQPALILNKNFEVIDANLHVVKKTGMPLEKLKKKKCYELFHPDKALPVEECPVQKLLETKRPEVYDAEMEILGETYMISCTPVFDTDKKLSKIIYIATDISERKKMELALRESEEKYRTVVETAREMIFIIKDGIIKYVNKSLLEINHVTESDLIGKPFLDFVAEDERKRIAQIHKNRVAEGISYLSYESKARTFSGEIREVEVSSTSITFEGEPATLVILHDITERKRVQKELQNQQEHLEELVKERTSELENKNKELQEKYRELENMNDLFVGREFRIKELKDKIAMLEEQLKSR